MKSSLTLAAGVAVLTALLATAAFAQPATGEVVAAAQPSASTAVRRGRASDGHQGVRPVPGRLLDERRHHARPGNRGTQQFPDRRSGRRRPAAQRLQVAFQRQMRSNILPRISPLPGPVPQDFSWGFRGEVLYGRNGLPAEMQGIETNWGIDRTSLGSAPGTTRQNYLAFPQLYGEFYLRRSWGPGLKSGGISRPIPAPTRPTVKAAPGQIGNSKTYAFVSQPDQIFGALASVNLMRSGRGLLSGEVGVAQGRQSFQDNNSQKSVIGALRWRSPTCKARSITASWSATSRTRPTLRCSCRKRASSRRMASSASITRCRSRRTRTRRGSLVGELLYGKQAGDGRPETIDVLTGIELSRWPLRWHQRRSALPAERPAALGGARRSLHRPCRNRAVSGDASAERLPRRDRRCPLRHYPQRRLSARAPLRLAKPQQRHQCVRRRQGLSSSYVFRRRRAELLEGRGRAKPKPRLAPRRASRRRLYERLPAPAPAFVPVPVDGFQLASLSSMM